MREGDYRERRGAPGVQAASWKAADCVLLTLLLALVALIALLALVALIVSGLVSLVGFALTVRKSSSIRTVAWITLIISVISFLLIAWTGYLGGQIRHSEIHAAVTVLV